MLSATGEEGDYPEAAVVVRVHFGSKPIEVMLDTGAQPSVIDKGTVEKLKLASQLKDSRVYGVGRSPIQVCGTMQVDIDIGGNRVISHQVDILDTGTKTVILGRNFLANFSEVCFDVKGFRVKLDDQWLETRTLLQGGKALGRAEVVQIESPSEQDQMFDIDPELSHEQRRAMLDVLRKHRTVFAVNPKSPREIHRVEHRITLIDHRPIRYRPLRVSPPTESEISRQIEEMLANRIVRPSESPWGSRIILVRNKTDHRGSRWIIAV